MQTKGCNYSLVYLLITYVIKDKPKKKNITVIPLSKWITRQQGRKRPDIAPVASAGHHQSCNYSILIQIASCNRIHARKQPCGLANAEIRRNSGQGLVATTPTAHRSSCVGLSGFLSGREGGVNRSMLSISRLRRVFRRIWHGRHD